MRIESGLRGFRSCRGLLGHQRTPSRLRLAIQAASIYFAQKAHTPRSSPAVGEDPDAMYRPWRACSPHLLDYFTILPKSCAFSVSVPPLWTVEHPDDMFIPQSDMLAHPQLPPGLIEHCLDVLKAIMPFKRELIRVVVEGFTTPLFDPTRRANARDEMTAEEGARADLTVLERVHEHFEDNATLEGFLTDWPCAARSWVSTRKPLVGLCLCSLIAKSIAVKSLRVRRAPPVHAHLDDFAQAQPQTHNEASLIDQLAVEWKMDLGRPRHDDHQRNRANALRARHGQMQTEADTPRASFIRNPAIPSSSPFSSIPRISRVPARFPAAPICTRLRTQLDELKKYE
ncbi:hypothetical protein B0H16DRAFT_1746224 [Mycena metata]|uniref:Uncharacterized protein n=1 Tax=Mycena metata TaxID=1033252 RepID=A0AAD7GZB6_9AGAR|nr:hypothetical protein B0H16DRAFT_1746224 [Mycena metata]